MDGYQTLRFRIIGVSPLLLHNGRLADPLDEQVRAIAQVTAKRKKTEADHHRVAELEFKGSLYLREGRPCIPEEMMEAALVKAASLERRGPKARAGLVVRESLLLEYDGPKDPDGLWRDQRFRLRCGVRVGLSRVMRTRPQFIKWEANLVIDYFPHLLNQQDMLSFLVTAGEQIGIGDWRPRFGRFSAQPVVTPERQAARRSGAGGRTQCDRCIKTR